MRTKKVRSRYKLTDLEAEITISALNRIVERLCRMEIPVTIDGYFRCYPEQRLIPSDKAEKNRLLIKSALKGGNKFYFYLHDKKRLHTYE